MCFLEEEVGELGSGIVHQLGFIEFDVGDGKGFEKKRTEQFFSSGSNHTKSVF